MTTAQYAITPNDPSYVSAQGQNISALIAQANIMYLEIVDSSDEKALVRPLCDWGLSNGEIIVIIVIIDIVVVSPFSLAAILKEKKKHKRERFLEFLRFQFDKST